MHGKKELDENDKQGLIRYFQLLLDFYRDAASKEHACFFAWNNAKQPPSSSIIV
jgi:hypothetical protein